MKTLIAFMGGFLCGCVALKLQEIWFWYGDEIMRERKRRKLVKEGKA